MLDKQTIALLASNGTESCQPITANADLSGIGVRIAFYLQSLMNALLVISSPKESVSIAWAGTLMTVSLVIAGMVGKFTAPSSLTLHHGTLIMNFVTLSCISSLATAPLLPLWRMTHGEYFRLQRERFAVSPSHRTLPETPDEGFLEDDFYVNVHKKRIKQEQKKGRVFIAFALLLQAVFQWVWGIILFVSPTYDDQESNGCTQIVMFLYPFLTRDINSLDDPAVGARFLVWPLWLIFCLGSSLALVIVLSVMGPSNAHDTSLNTSNFLTSTGSTRTPVILALGRAARSGVQALRTMNRGVLLVNTLVFLVWAALIFSSEWQRNVNNIDSSENDIRGFGQITALLLAMAPAWSLWTAFKENWAALRRRQHRERREGTSTGSAAAARGPDIAHPAGYTDNDNYEMTVIRRVSAAGPPRILLSVPLRTSEEGEGGVMASLLAHVESGSPPASPPTQLRDREA